MRRKAPEALSTVHCPLPEEGESGGVWTLCSPKGDKVALHPSQLDHGGPSVPEYPFILQDQVWDSVLQKLLKTFLLQGSFRRCSGQ